MSQQASTSPFADLLLPGSLATQRRVEAESPYEGASFWMRRAAKYGEDLRQGLRAKGYNLTDEDVAAARNQEVLQGITSSVSERMERGDISPEDAQHEVLRTAMETFIGLGDYETAAKIAPELTAITKRQAELDKIRSEIGENVAQAGEAQAGAYRTVARTPEEVALLQEQQATERARQGMFDRSPRATAGGAGVGGDVTNTEKGKYRQQVLGATGVLRRMTDLTGLLFQSPGVASDAAATIGSLSGKVKDAATLASKEAPDNYALDSPKRRQLEAQARRTYEQVGSQLNVDVARFGSMAMDLAYTLARARDPGGRLSDADIENAMKILGAAGDGEAMKAVLQDIVKNTYQDLVDARGSSEWHATLPLNEQLDEQYETFNATVTRYKGGGKPKAGKDGWTTLPDGTRFRVKE